MAECLGNRSREFSSRCNDGRAGRLLHKEVFANSQKELARGFLDSSTTATVKDSNQSRPRHTTFTWPHPGPPPMNRVVIRSAAL
jgi:hypothetical protein